MTTQPSTLDEREAPAPLVAARALGPGVRAAADRIEHGRRLPDDVVTALAEAGLFRLCVPETLGGSESDPATLVAVVETIGAADGSAGWCVAIGATSGLLSGYLDEPVARAIYGPHAAISGGVFAPKGTATPVDGGYRVTGRWPFASGCQHCAWLMGGTLVVDGGKPRLLASGAPDVRLMVFPAADATVIDTWSVAGLAGTGSHDIAVDDVFVPAERSVSLITDAPRESRPLYLFPVFGLLAIGIAAVALGIARAAIDELVVLAGGKTPTGGRKRLAERPMIQAQVAQAEALLRAGARLSPRGDRRRVARRARDARDLDGAAGDGATRRDACDPQRRGCRRSDVRRRRRHVRLPHEPAATLLSRRPRRDPAHDGRAGDVRARRQAPARRRRRDLAAVRRA